MSAFPAELPAFAPQEIIYPERDGKPMAENTKQARWITVLYENLEALFASDPNVFVAIDNLWYPVEGRPDIRLAPDVYVVFGRPKGDRGSYLQWREDNLPLTVVFEILSPSSDIFEMVDKLQFYDDHGVEEYYVYDPETNRLLIYRRGNILLARQTPAHNYQSPRMGIRFDLSGEELVVRYPDGRLFVRLMEERQRADQAELALSQSQEALSLNKQKLGRIRELSRKFRTGQATPEEIAELDRLEEENGK